MLASVTAPMAKTASTQEELERSQLHGHYLERAKELMQDATRDGVVLRLDMHTATVKDSFKSSDSVIVAPFIIGKGPTLLYPEPDTTGQKYAG